MGSYYEGEALYLPTRTIKSTALELLECFSHDDLYDNVKTAVLQESNAAFKCPECHYDSSDLASMRRAAGLPAEVEDEVSEDTGNASGTISTVVSPAAARPNGRPVDTLAVEVLLPILEKLDYKSMAAFAAASGRVRQVASRYDLLRRSRLQCLATHMTYEECDLGIAVSAMKYDVQPQDFQTRWLHTECGLYSYEAYYHWPVTHTVTNTYSCAWLPLPLSRDHWSRGRSSVMKDLQLIFRYTMPATFDAELNMGSPPKDAAVLVREGAGVLYTLMLNVVLRFTHAYRHRYDSRTDGNLLHHPSDRAIQSCFDLLHLLVCLADEHPAIAAGANEQVRSFYVDKRRDKDACPNLGLLLLARLIADDDVVGDDAAQLDFTQAIVNEAMTRNVVWLLDPRGAGHAELAHLEPDGTVSEYRLAHSFLNDMPAYNLTHPFMGSLTSYHLIMFMERFRLVVRQQLARGATPATGATALDNIRECLFDGLGVPPMHVRTPLLADLRRLRTVHTWPEFVAFMGLPVPSKASLCDALRQAVRDSMARGYSQWALSPAQSKALREYFEAGFEEARNGPARPRLVMHGSRGDWVCAEDYGFCAASQRLHDMGTATYHEPGTTPSRKTPWGELRAWRREMPHELRKTNRMWEPADENKLEFLGWQLKRRWVCFFPQKRGALPDVRLYDEALRSRLVERHEGTAPERWQLVAPVRPKKTYRCFGPFP